jgi:hypothetical protein
MRNWLINKMVENQYFQRAVRRVIAKSLRGEYK